MTDPFDTWRGHARGLVSNGTAPELVSWNLDGTPGSLFPPESGPVKKITVPSEFFERARFVAMHRDVEKWNVLYNLLFRVVHERKDLLHNAADPTVARLHLMEKALRRDIHKMHAFVRFRKIDDNDGERYVAFYRPDNLIVPAATPFFARRFASMRWTIFTPDESATWDGERLLFGDGVADGVLPDDATDDLWRTYYSSIFNPARLNVKMMKREMPVRFWENLPEAKLIPELTRDAAARVDKMAGDEWLTAAAFVPPTHNWASLKAAARKCEGCPLYQNGTQTIFGEGPIASSMVLVGEAPGDEEERSGHPFTGPAGKLLDQAMLSANVQRSEVYLTNAVKHFKYERSGDRRIHKTPKGSEISACRDWIIAELELIQPKVIVALGASAAQSVLGRRVSILKERGVPMHSRWGHVVLTLHPSAILRQPDDESRETFFHHLQTDLHTAWQLSKLGHPKENL